MDNITKSHIRQIKQAMRQKKLVIFAGAGVSKWAGVPLWGELIDELKKELDLPQYETDYLKIPQLYKNLRKGKEFQERVKDILRDGEVQYNKIHEALLDLKPCHIVTTNYDDLFEQAIANSNENFFTVSKDEDLPFNKGERLLIKMHGDFRSGNIVLTENDYLDYAKNFPLIRSYVMSLFASKLVLFVGFSFSDINLKYILRDVRNCLGGKMQPVYMLTSAVENVHIVNYLDDNFVNMVQIGKDDAAAVLKEQGVECVQSFFEDVRSQTLYNQLVCIGRYSEIKSDFFLLFENFLADNIEQFHHLGRYIKYVFPAEMRSQARLIDGILTIPEGYVTSAKKLFEDSAEAKAFRESNKDSLLKILLWLNANGVMEIKDVVNVNSFLDSYQLNEMKGDLTYIYDLDIKKVAAILEERGNKPLNYTKDDLMYPYMLCLIGRYKEAYDCYKRLLNVMIARKKYVLAFICKYNMRSLYGPVMNEIVNWSKEMWTGLNKEIGGIDLQDALNNMPIDGLPRVVLTDLASGKYFADRLIEANDYRQKLKSQHVESLKGGISFNSNIVHVLWTADEMIDFDHNNYIYNEPFSRCRQIYMNITEGILHSVLTKDSKFGSTKLKNLDGEMADVFVFYLQPNDLGELLNKLMDKERLDVDHTFINRIKQWMENLYEASAEGHYQQAVFSRKRIGEIILNILWLSLYTKTNLELPHVYSLIKEYWFDGRMMVYDKLYNEFFYRYPASAKEAVGIMERILHSNIGYARRLDYTVANLCHYIEEGGEKVEELISVKMIQNSNNIQYIASFCRVATDDVKEEIISYLQDNVKSLYQLLEAQKYSKSNVMTAALVRKLKDTFATRDENILFAEEYVCANMKWIFDKCQDEQLKGAIEECFSINNCYQFMRNPEMYEGLVSEIPGSWYLYVEDEVLKRLLRNPLAVNNVKQFCKQNPWYKDFKEKIWNLL